MTDKLSNLKVVVKEHNKINLLTYVSVLKQQRFDRETATQTDEYTEQGRSRS
jgi:hypothetical protein